MHTSMFQKHIVKAKFYPSADDFTRVLMILHKRCLWCLWQISCLMWNCSHMMIGQDCANSFPPWWMSLWCGPWTLPWPWPRTLINCHCHWLAKDLSCETWSQILTSSRSCFVVRHVRFQKLIHVPTMWTFCSYLFFGHLCVMAETRWTFYKRHFLRNSTVLLVIDFELEHIYR